MNRINEKELHELIAIGGEQRSVEFKQGERRENRRFAGKILRAMIAMAHRPDGGAIIIGVCERDGKPLAVGVEPDVAKSWESHDEWADKIRTHVDPPIDFALYSVTSQAMKFIVLIVQSFADTPIICVKEWKIDSLEEPKDRGQAKKTEQILRVGSIYVRSLDKPESKEARPAEMRELFELAFEKRVARFAKLRAIENLASDDRVRKKDARDSVEQEKGRLLQAVTLKFPSMQTEVMKRGYWVISIALLSNGDLSRLDYDTLSTRVKASQVVAGWNFPHFNETALVREQNFVMARTEFGPHREAWALSENGVFTFVAALQDDWPERPIWGPPRTYSVLKKNLNVYDVVRKYLEAYTFALRLGNSGACDQIKIKIELHNLSTRELYLSPSRPFYGQELSLENFVQNMDYSLEELQGRGNEEAFKKLQELFSRAGWAVEVSTLRDIAEELR